MAKNKKFEVIGSEVSFFHEGKEDYISLTDLAKHKNAEHTGVVIAHWLSTRYTVEFMGIWERVNNPNFNVTGFSYIRNESGSNGYVLSAKQWIEKTKAIGITSKAGRYGGTYAHKDIAFEFATWISPELKFYLIKEFQRLKEAEHKQLGWDVRRQLTKINYSIHTDAIKENLIPPTLTKQQISFVYASEADLLNVALFGKTAKEWRDENADKKGNIRDYSNVSQLVCLANLETLNAHFIQESLATDERLKLLNKTAIQQMKLLHQNALDQRRRGSMNALASFTLNARGIALVRKIMSWCSNSLIECKHNDMTQFSTRRLAISLRLRQVKQLN